MRRRSRLVIFSLVVSLFLMGNAPAPWYACEGKAPGDPCQWGYGCSTNGVCQLVDNCVDDPATELNECLQCHTG